MNPIEKRYLAHIQTLDVLRVPGVDRVITVLLILLIGFSVAVLWFTPWIQTASGEGVVSTVNPSQRTQAISALVPGQIETWHVKEGDRVKEGDPIVTLRDTDQDLMDRLTAEIVAMEQQQTANINALETDAWTSIEMGAKWASLLLDPSIRPTIKQMADDELIEKDFEIRPIDYGTQNVIKAMVVLSDGANSTLRILVNKLPTLAILILM